MRGRQLVHGAFALVDDEERQDVMAGHPFAEGGSGMRWYDEPLEYVATIKDGEAEYVLTCVDQPRSPNGLGHPWAEPV